MRSARVEPRSPVPEVDQRRARGERTRRQLIDGALDLFDKKGYDATTVGDIAAAADVTERSFFHHFASKDDVLFDGYADRLSEGTRRFRTAASDGSLWDALVAASEPVVAAVEDHPDLFLLRSRLYGSAPALRASMLRINEDWIEVLLHEVAGFLGVDPATHLGARLATSLVNSANRGALDVWAAAGGQIDLRTVAEDAWRTIRPTIDVIERESRRG